jgi:hypothetical protein
MDRRIPVRAEHIIEKRLPDELVLVNAATNELLAPSKGGEAIWKLIDGQRTIDEIVSGICAEYGVRPDYVPGEEPALDAVGEVLQTTGNTLSEQVQSFLSLLLERGLVVLRDGAGTSGQSSGAGG